MHMLSLLPLVISLSPPILPFSLSSLLLCFSFFFLVWNLCFPSVISIYDGLDFYFFVVNWYTVDASTYSTSKEFRQCMTCSLAKLCIVNILYGNSKHTVLCEKTKYFLSWNCDFGMQRWKFLMEVEIARQIEPYRFLVIPLYCDIIKLLCLQIYYLCWLYKVLF